MPRYTSFSKARWNKDTFVKSVAAEIQLPLEPNPNDLMVPKGCKAQEHTYVLS